MLKDAVEKFYRSIINLKSREDLEQFEKEWFARFPEECCSETTFMLATYLYNECHLNNIVRYCSVWIWNDRRGHSNHSWLKVEDMHIDITYSQFDKSYDIIFANNHPIFTWWQLSFNNPDIRELSLSLKKFDYSLSEFNQDSMKKFHKIYELILGNIKL